MSFTWRCVADMLRLAKEKGFDKVTASIYSFNEQSRRMFRSLGFEETADGRYEYLL